MKPTILFCAFSLVAAGNLVLMSDAEAQGIKTRTASQSPTKSAPSAKPREVHRQSIGSRGRSRSASPVAPAKSAQNADKAASRNQAGQSATSVVGSRNQMTAAGPTVTVSTPSGIQQIPGTPPQAREAQSRGSSRERPSLASPGSQQARLATVQRTSASGKTTTLAASPAK